MRRTAAVLVGATWRCVAASRFVPAGTTLPAINTGRVTLESTGAIF